MAAEAAGGASGAASLLRRSEQLKKAVFDEQTDELNTQVQQQYVAAVEQALLACLDYSVGKDALLTLWTDGYKAVIDRFQQTIRSKGPKTKDARMQLSTFLRYSYASLHRLLLRLCQTYDLPGLLQQDDHTKQLASNLALLTGLSSSHNVKRFVKRHAKSCLPATARSVVHFFCVHIGDIHRYQKGLELAEQCYSFATDVLPENGHAFNQLAILAHARNQLVECVYLYERALHASQAFEPAAANIERLFQQLLGRSLNMPLSTSESELPKVSVFVLKLFAHVHFDDKLAEIERSVLPALVLLVEHTINTQPLATAKHWLGSHSPRVRSVWLCLCVTCVLNRAAADIGSAADNVSVALIALLLKSAVSLCCAHNELLADWLPSLYVMYMWLSDQPNATQMLTRQEPQLLALLEQQQPADTQVPCDVQGCQPFEACLSGSHEQLLFGDADVRAMGLAERLTHVLHYIDKHKPNTVQHAVKHKSKVVALRKFLNDNKTSELPDSGVCTSEKTSPTQELHSENKIEKEAKTAPPSGKKTPPSVRPSSVPLPTCSRNNGRSQRSPADTNVAFAAEKTERPLLPNPLHKTNVGQPGKTEKKAVSPPPLPPRFQASRLRQALLGHSSHTSALMVSPNDAAKPESEQAENASPEASPARSVLEPSPVWLPPVSTVPPSAFVPLRGIAPALIGCSQPSFMPPTGPPPPITTNTVSAFRPPPPFVPVSHGAFYNVPPPPLPPPPGLEQLDQLHVSSDDLIAAPTRPAASADGIGRGSSAFRSPVSISGPLFADHKPFAFPHGGFELAGSSVHQAQQQQPGDQLDNFISTSSCANAFVPEPVPPQLHFASTSIWSQQPPEQQHYPSWSNGTM